VAFGGSRGAPTELKAAPSRFIHIFADEKPIVSKSKISVGGADVVELQMPANNAQSLVNIRAPKAKRVTVRPGTPVEVQFQMRRPPADNPVQSINVPIADRYRESERKVNVTFQLFRDAESSLRLPAISCGHYWPNAQVRAVANGETKSATFPGDGFDLEDGKLRSQPFGTNIGSDANGNADFSAKCNATPPSKTTVAENLQFQVNAFGKCAGNGGGGLGLSDPQWQSQIDLPGLAGQTWSITVKPSALQFHAQHPIECTFRVDGRTQGLTTGGLAFNSIAPGRHTIELSCKSRQAFPQAASGGCMGGPIGSLGSNVERVVVDITATKEQGSK
jgi:hypothetical protein